jgi:CO/xanthine dehydrogenase FAD-binding subunit
VAAGTAYRAIRNRGTIGGSIAHADPAADWFAGAGRAWCNDQYQAIGGVRSIPVEHRAGRASTALRDNEIIGP